MAPQREWFEKDYYKALGVSKTASDKEITRAYRKLAKQYHPDSNPGKEDQFKDISAAYEVLGDTAKRKEYDEIRSMAGPGGYGAGRAGAGGFGGGTHVEDLSDLIGGLFNRGSRRSSGAHGPVRGSDQEVEVYIGFEDAVHGITTTLNVVSDVKCETCHGTGSAPGSSPVVCARCQGTGSVADNQGFFSFSLPCPACGGRGVRIEHACPVCRGSGVEPKNRQIKVRIPHGVDNGSKIRLKGKGSSGTNGGPAGDLYVVIHVSPHQIFSRRGADLLLTVPVTFAEAVFGTTLTVPTLDGQVSLKVPAGAKSGLTLRARSKGLPKSGKTAEMGDLLVTVEIDVPQHLSPEQKKAVEEFAQATTESPRRNLEVEANARK
ncbi:MAG: molecular chaperone DnaJ [Acidimicrobiaceae bacterium]|nr:molecular chaperone DnaJ [Acidimicrobiaceae bacterium]